LPALKLAGRVRGRSLSGYAAARKRGAPDTRIASLRKPAGAIPNNRLNALESANSVAYPTSAAIAASVVSPARRCDWASPRRCAASHRSGEVPVARLKRRANGARDRPTARARVATVHRRAGSAFIALMARSTYGSGAETSLAEAARGTPKGAVEPGR